MAHFVIVILGEKEYTSMTESGSRTLRLLFLSRIIENKIRTSSCHTAQLTLFHDEARILIFDDPAQ
jgi:hypothetical protein